MSINRGRMTTTQGELTSLVEILFSPLYLLVKSFEEDIQSFGNHMVEAEHLDSFENSFK